MARSMVAHRLFDRACDVTSIVFAADKQRLFKHSVIYAAVLRPQELDALTVGTVS